VTVSPEKVRRASLVVLAVYTAAFAAAPAAAADRVAVRLGMSMAEVEPYLRRECAQLMVGGEGEKYITCELRSGGLITAKVSPKDRVTYSVYREPGDFDGVAALAAEVARELGYEGEGHDCMVHSDPSLCWEKGTTKFWVYKAPDSEGRISTFQSDKAMAAEDG
jgi:hypothetical protein